MPEMQQKHAVLNLMCPVTSVHKIKICLKHGKLHLITSIFHRKCKRTVTWNNIFQTQ